MTAEWSPGIRIGQAAPAFDLPCVWGDLPEPGRVSNTDFRAQWLILIFYPRDFSMVCPTELVAFSERLIEFRDRQCQVVGISVDSLDSHRQWLATRRAEGGVSGLRFPLASDVDGAVSRKFGVFDEKNQVSLRGLFIVDPDGILQYEVVHNLSVGRRSEEVLRVLDALRSGGLCAEGWTIGANSIEITTPLQPGRVLSHYRITETIGDGSFAIVYRAMDLRLDRPVALKVMRSASRASMSALLGEARAAAQLNHVNVGSVYDVDDSNGSPIIAMEYVDGKPLSQIIDAGRLDYARTLAFARQIAAGLVAAHKAGVVHGDLKPANIMVSNEGVVKLVDFGLAQRRTRLVEGKIVADVDATVEILGPHGAITGTPLYMSPEQTHGDFPNSASDVFAFGGIVYEMLTGHPTVTGATVPDVIDQIRRLDPERLTTGLPDPFARIIRDCLAPRKSDRPTIHEIQSRLSSPADFGDYQASI